MQFLSLKIRSLIVISVPDGRISPSNSQCLNEINFSLTLHSKNTSSFKIVSKIVGLVKTIGSKKKNCNRQLRQFFSFFNEFYRKTKNLPATFNMKLIFGLWSPWVSLEMHVYRPSASICIFSNINTEPYCTFNVLILHIYSKFISF